MLESFLKLLDGQRPERTVWTADITYWMAGQKASGRSRPDWDREDGYLELHRDLGIMPYYYYDKFWVASPQYSGGIEVTQKADGGRALNSIRTPVGTRTEINTYLPSSCSTGCTKHYVQSERDLDVLLYILEHRCLVPDNLQDYPERMSLWERYGGLPCLGLPRSPLCSLMYEWAGIEQTSYLLADYPDRVAAALGLMEEQEEPILDAVCQVRPPLVHFPDNLSSDNLAGCYDAYLRRTHAARLERLHAAGIKVAVHLDGTVRGLLGKLVAVGFDAIEALTPAPAGDLTLAQIAETAGSESVILWGGVPGVMFSAPYTWADMEAHVKQLLECWRGRPFVVGVADQVPPDGDVALCRRIAEMLRP